MPPKGQERKCARSLGGKGVCKASGTFIWVVRNFTIVSPDVCQSYGHAKDTIRRVMDSGGHPVEVNMEKAPSSAHRAELTSEVALAICCEVSTSSNNTSTLAAELCLGSAH